MKNTFRIEAVHATGETTYWENVISITSNLNGYLITYVDEKTGAVEEHQIEHWQVPRIRLSILYYRENYRPK